MKEKFIKSNIILIIGGAITKVLGILIRILTTRIIGVEGIGLYMLIFPTFTLFVTISQLGFPIAISKLVAEESHNNKRLVISTIPISLIINLILMLIIILLAPYLSNNLLKDSRCYYPIISIALVLPFDSISSILRGYFFGKQRMLPHVISNIFEQIVRIILITLIIPLLLNKSLIFAVSGLILTNIFSELSSIIILSFCLPKNFSIKKEDIKPDPTNIKEILQVALPTTGGRLIGSIGYFFEPILLTSALLYAGYTSNFIIKEYGIIEGYVMPLLLLPGFFTNAISSALIPVISYSYQKGNKSYVKRKLRQAIFISLAIGIPITIILMINPGFFLNLIYNTKEGSSYLRFIAPFFLIYYIESPLASTLQSINKAKNMMFDNLKGITIKTCLLFILSLFKIGLYGFLIAICLNIIITTYCHYINIKKSLQTI